MDIQEILKHAERGVHQAPTLAGYRHPYIKGWKEIATASPDKIKAMASNGYAGCNWVSVAKDGFVCMLDIDDVEYAKSIGMPNSWDTFTVNTPSGGLHVYLWHTQESVSLGNTNILGPDGRPAIEFKANNLTCASPGVYRSDKEPHGYYAPANNNEIQPISKELVEFLRTHGKQKKQYAARASKREFHPTYELEDEIEHYDWHMTGKEKVGSDGVRYIEFAICPIDEEVHAGMEEAGNFKCCLTIGDYGLGFACQAGRHQDLSISGVWEACEERGIEPYPYCRYLDDDKTLEGRILTNVFGAEDADQVPNEDHASQEADLDGHKLTSASAAIDTEGYTYRLQDTGNAERLVRKFGHILRYVYETGTWRYWDGKIWADDKCGKLDRMAKMIVDEIYAEAFAGDEPDSALLKHAMKSAGKERRKAMIDLAATEKPVVTNVGDYDKDPWLFNCSNGTLNLKTCEFRGHRREDLITKISAVVYDSGATCPKFDVFIRWAHGGDQQMIDFLARAAGHSLTGDTSIQALFFNHGDGANGKGTFTELMRYIMGSYGRDTNFNTFINDKNKSEHRNDIAALRGARFVTASESSDGHHLDEELIKKITGGDPITCREIFGKPMTYFPAFKLWFQSNYQPTIKGQDWGIWRRVKMIPWEQTIGKPIPLSRNGLG